jgi:CubicO group peptidase (beta-lactamase class C family)
LHKIVFFMICIALRARLLLVFLLVLLCTAAVSAQDAKRLAAQIDSLIAQNEHGAFNGVIVISKAGKTLYEKAYGVADKTTMRPLTVNDQFGGGSTCKQFTAVLVLQQMEQGRLQLDDKIGRYLPGLTAAWKDSVTIRQLLQHTSGVYAPDAPLAFAPGNSCLYANYGYQLLGQIVEHTSGRSFCEMASALFARCHMTSTVDPVLCAGSAKQLVQGYLVRPDGQLKVTDSMVPLLCRIGEASGGIITTAKDLVRWNDCLHGGGLLKAGTYKMMWQPSGKIRRHSVFGETSYGCSFPLQLHSRLRKICHSGLVGGAGFYCINFYYPGTKTSLVVMQNIGNESILPAELFYYQTTIAQILEDRLLNK